MRIRIIVVGKTKEPFLQEGEEIFLSRIRRYVELEWVIVKPDKNAESLARAAESKRIIAKMNSVEWNIALHSEGKQMTSTQLADYFSQKMSEGCKCMTFIIGGALGMNEEVLRRTNLLLGLSKMTFTHEMCRLILLEQIYRAYSIIKGEKYHK